MFARQARQIVLQAMTGCILSAVTACAAHAQLSCPTGPMMGCTGPVAVGGSQLLIKPANLLPRRAKLNWKVTNADTTFTSQFGDPVNGTTEYAVCIYDGGSLVYEGIVPPQGTCEGAAPCWSGNVNGYRYRDPSAIRDGIARIKVRNGVEGRARVLVRARNNIVTPTLDTALTPPPYGNQVTAQIINDGGECWEARFDNGVVPFERNDSILFRAWSIGP